MSTFGEKLKTLRKSNRKTQQQVASELTSLYPDFEMSQANISHLENRDTAPREEILDILAEYFGITKMYFFEMDNSSYEQRKPQIASYLESLDSRVVSEHEVKLHTDDNSSGDDDTLDTLENLKKWYDGGEIAED